MNKILELWDRLRIHGKLTVILTLLGIMCFLVIKFSIWFILGSIIFFIAILRITKDKNLLKFLIPTSLFWILISFLLKFKN